MNNISYDGARRPEILKIAVSTDTILYTPFFLAYYSGDFENTPFGKISVNIIGTQDDARFDKNEKLKGDGFATFCLLLDLADAAICDPSYLVYLNAGNVPDINNEFEAFEKLLTQQTKKKLEEKFKAILRIEENKLKIVDTNKFKELFSNKLIIGGLISKIAFSVVVGPNLDQVVNYETYKEIPEKFGFEHIKGSTKKSFISKEVSGNFIYYKTPSTGNCLGRIHATKYEKIPKYETTADFGFELDYLQKAAYVNSLAITCDFVSLDFLLNKDNDSSRNVNVSEIQDLALDNTNYLFTGILGNVQVQHEEKLKALLYGIDKNLFAISRFLVDDDTTGLTKYFRQKFNYTEQKQSELLNLLVADEKCRKKINDFIDDKTKPDFTFDTIIKYYVNRLYEWKKCGGLYYQSTYPTEKANGLSELRIENDLSNITKLRYHAIDKDTTYLNNDIKKFIYPDLLSSWRKTEKQYWFFEKKVNEFRLKEKWFDIVLLFLAPFLFIYKKWKINLYTKIWFYINKPTYIYTVGSIFLAFEIIIGIFHIWGYHIPVLVLPIHWSTIDPHGNINSILNFSIDVRLILFFYLNAIVLMLIFLARHLWKLKQEDEFVYRNE